MFLNRVTNEIEILSEPNREAREDKIPVLKKAILEGTYQVQAADSARKILQTLVFDLLLLTSRKSEYQIEAAN